MDATRNEVTTIDLTDVDSSTSKKKAAKILTVTDLNGDALIKCMEYLSLDDLCSMAHVCKRFRKAANEAFINRYADCIEFDDLIFNMQNTSRAIKCFGRFMASITINGSIVWDLNIAILELLNEYCNNLEKLRLICFNIDKPTSTIMKTLFTRLDTIEMFYCRSPPKPIAGVHYNAILKGAEQMKELVIIGRNEQIDLKCLNKKWNCLEKLELISVSLTDEEVLGHLLKKNRSIKYFSYIPNTKSTHWMSGFDAFSPKLLNLSLQPGNIYDFSFFLSEIRALRCIVINCFQYEKKIHSIVECLKSLKDLEVFSLWHADFRHFLTLPKLNNVKILELRLMKSIYDKKQLVSEIFKQWNNVDDLYVDHSIVRDADDLGVFVENLPKLKSLYLCETKSFFILPTEKQFNLWCSMRHHILHIYVDACYLMQNKLCDPDQRIIFKPFKNRICQIVDVSCSANL